VPSYRSKKCSHQSDVDPNEDSGRSLASRARSHSLPRSAGIIRETVHADLLFFAENNPTFPATFLALLLVALFEGHCAAMISSDIVGLLDFVQTDNPILGPVALSA
jgi:hypothetical protein